MKNKGIMPFSLQECKMSVCSILVTSPVEKAYDYLIPEGMELALGDYVSVPLGPRVVHGVVWAVAEGGGVWRGCRSILQVEICSGEA
jgi:primosomal protein N' (replication factor Y)